MKPLEKANLPTGDVKLVAVSAQAGELIKVLGCYGIGVIRVSPSPKIIDGTASHADLHLLHLGENELWISREQSDKAAQLKSYGFNVKIFHIF